MRSSLPAFKQSNSFTMGIELELQLVNLQNFNLAMEAEDFLRRLSETSHSGELKPEMTQGMIEINSSIHTSYSELLSELHHLRKIISEEAAQTHIGVCGGGTHPFQKWKEQRIFQTERFANISEQYGYLAKQFTVFGQHIHIACPNGDDALYLCHAMAPYLPHFIALSAASPFSQGVDTSFDCARLAAVNAFPLSGTPPWLLHWSEFDAYFSKISNLGIVKSIKDFYWDIRPKPEYGTIEIRICDTPLTVEKAADLAAYAQLLVVWLLAERPALSHDIYLTYLMNRFRAARYGLEATIVNVASQEKILLADDILKICQQLQPLATEFGSQKALTNIRDSARNRENGAVWLRTQYANLRSLNDTVRAQTERWCEIL